MKARDNRACRADIARVVARHAVGWLAAGNAVGVLLAALLVWPALNAPFAPLTYGRWIPLHLDWQLYGACALPLVGVLLAWCVDPRHPQALGQARVALGVWSAALLLGGLAWLSGVSSGKLFLEWHGWARPLLPVAMLGLWSVLSAHVWWRRAELSPGERAARIGVLLVLLVVPNALHWAAGREVYPSVNPDSGGATGARLLASTLGIVAIYGFIAEVLGLGRKDRRAWYWGYLLLSGFVAVASEQGQSSHHEPAQVLGLATLLGWLPLAWIFFRGGRGEPAARRWWGAAFGWWVALVVSGLLTFLPGFSERLKYTNAMVGHAHLAMAGLVTCANIAVLVELRGLNAPRHFWLWQGACVVHVAVLLALGWCEAGQAGDLFLAAPWTQAVYAVRLLAGVAMLLVSWQWWWGTFHRSGSEADDGR